MKNYFKHTILFSLLALCHLSYSQKSKTTLKLNLLVGIGLDTHGIKDPNGFFDTDKITFSGGGGVGLEAGIGYALFPRLIAEASASFQLQVISKSINANTSTAQPVDDNTSISFNRKTFLLGAKYKLPMVKRRRPVYINLGGGGGLAIPGALKIVSNGQSLGDINYKSSLAYYLLSEMEIPVGKKNSLNAGVRFKDMNFKIDSYSKGSVSDVPSEYHNFSGIGFDIFAGFVFGL